LVNSGFANTVMGYSNLLIIPWFSYRRFMGTNRRSRFSPRSG